MIPLLVTEHDPRRLIMLDTGLGFERSDAPVLIHLITKPRPSGDEGGVLHSLVRNLGERCGVGPTDVMVAAIENGDTDWSFGVGRGQFLTGEL